MSYFLALWKTVIPLETLEFGFYQSFSRFMDVHDMWMGTIDFMILDQLFWKFPKKKQTRK